MTGSQKDVYTVTLEENGSLKCSCPDSNSHAKKAGVVCKHICFIYIKICKGVDMDFFEKKKLTQLDIDALKTRTQILISGGTAKKYYKLYIDAITNTTDFTVAKRDGVLEDACCPICMDDLVSDVVFCPSCSNPVHDKCIEKWLEQHKTCIFCRSDVWKKYHSSSTDVNDDKIGKKYINLNK